MVRFFVVSIGLLAYVLARTFTQTTEFPPYIFWAIGAMAVANTVLVVVGLVRSKKYELMSVLNFSFIVGAISFAVVFGITWVISS